MVTFPQLEWVQQSLSTDPSGSRHLSSPGAGFIKNPSTTVTNELDFGTLNNTGSGAITDTKLVYARINSLGDASGVFNMKFFLTSVSAWNLGTYRFLEQKELHFVPNVVLNSAANNTPTIIPATTNLVGTIQFPQFQNGAPWISGVEDIDVTQYIYIAVEVHNNVPTGTYGGAGAGSFRYRLLYDFS
jgi:hypothetical protein